MCRVLQPAITTSCETSFALAIDSPVTCQRQPFVPYLADSEPCMEITMIRRPYLILTASRHPQERQRISFQDDLRHHRGPDTSSVLGSSMSHATSGLRVHHQE